MLGKDIFLLSHLGVKQSTRYGSPTRLNRTVMCWSGVTDTEHNGSYEEK